MGRNARLKKERRQKRNQESWDSFVRPGFLAEVRRMVLESGARADSCICCTKVLCQIGESLGLRVEPLVVEAFAYNAAFVLHFANNGFDITPDDMEKIAGNGGRYVVVGSREDKDRDPGENKWRGHLVAVVYPPRDVQSKPYVLDISMDQAHRPEKGLFLQEPVAFPVPSKKFIEGTQDAIGLTEVNGHKMCLVYKAHPDVTDYDVSPDWSRDYGAKAHDKIDFGDMPEKTPSE